jgi:DNA-binding Lrp family transcriptional regulator
MKDIYNQIIGYLLKNTNSTFSQIVNDCGLNVHAAGDALKELMDRGVVGHRGYHAIVDQYFVIGGKEFYADKNFGALFSKNMVE